MFFGSSNKEPDVLAVLEHQYDIQNVKVEIEKVILPNFMMKIVYRGKKLPYCAT